MKTIGKNFKKIRNKIEKIYYYIVYRNLLTKILLILIKIYNNYCFILLTLKCIKQNCFFHKKYSGAGFLAGTPLDSSSIAATFPHL